MAIRFDATADAAHITSAGGLFGKTWSICGWMYHVADTTSHSFLYIRSSNTAGTQYVSLATDGLKKFRIEDHTGSSSYGSTLNDNQWYFVAFRVNDGGASECLIDGASYITRTTGAQTDSGNQSLYVGGSTAQHVNCRLMAIKVWDGVALTNDEFELERRNLRPVVRLNNLWGWWPMFSGASERLRNWAVGGRDLTADGTLTDEDPGPTAWIVAAPFVASSASTGSGDGSATGTGTATGVGASTAASTAAASGTGTATGVGASTAASTASASGAGTAAATGLAIFSGDGAASGAGTASGVGAATAAATGAATGTGTAAATGASTAASAGAAAGTGAAAGVGSSTAETVGAATGVGTAAGVGASTATAVGSAAGLGTATGFAPGVQSGDGAATGTGTASGVGASTAAATGTATGTGTASGVGADATPGTGGEMPAAGPFIGSVGQLKVLLPIESAASYPDVVVTLSLQGIYDQAPGRSNANGNRVSSGLKTPAADASSLPGGAGTLNGTDINVPPGTPTYTEWDLTGYQLVFGTSTTASFTDCTLDPNNTQIAVLAVSAGVTLTVSFDWCTIIGTNHRTDFNGNFRHADCRMDLTVTNCYFPDERGPDVFVRFGTATGNYVITDNYFGPIDNPGSTTDHVELFHDFATGAGAWTVEFKRNFVDWRASQTDEGADNPNGTGYLFSENGSNTVDWTVEDNIFVGFGDLAGLLSAVYAFQMAGVGTNVFNRNAIQNIARAGQSGSGSGHFSAGGNVDGGTNNRRWGADGSLDTLIVEGGVS